MDKYISDYVMELKSCQVRPNDEWETTDGSLIRRIISHKQEVYSRFCKAVLKLRKEHSFLNYLEAYYLLLMYEKVAKNSGDKKEMA